MAQHSNRPPRRRAAHSRTTDPRPGYRPDSQAEPDAEPGWSYFGEDHPSWPVGSEGPDWPQPGTDYPSWPANADHSGWSGDGGQQGWSEGAADPHWSYPAADHPSWPAGAGGADWPQPGADYPSWPAGAPGGGWAPERGGSAWSPQEAPVAQHHDERQQPASVASAPVASAPVASAQVPATRSGYPARRYVGAHAKTWSAQLARTQDTATQTYYELAFGDGRLQVMLTEPPKTGHAWALGGHARPLESDDLRNSDAVRIAERILSDADYRAGERQREASAQATAIREAAEAEATEIRQQASTLQQQATDQAAAIRQAAEAEATEMRAATQSMSGELHRVAAYVTQNLATPGAPPAALQAAAPAALTAAAPAALTTEPATRPARPVAKPARPDTKPAARPARPTTKPAKPAAKPATKPAGRQSKVMRKMVFAIAAVSAIGAVAGTTELALHGGPFFALRANGAGAGETGPREPVNPVLPQKAGEVQCSLLHLACTLK